MSLAHGFECGQIFRWRRVGQSWVGALGGTGLALREEAGGIGVGAVGEAITLGAVAWFLGQDVSLEAARARLDTDPVIHACLEALPGLRLLRQDPWECLISYVCSAWNNIPKIQRSTECLAQCWGRRHEVPAEGGMVPVYSFPSPAVLAAVSVEELRGCGLGYRAPYVAGTARVIAAGGLDLEALRSASYQEALTALLALPGIGRKVADCTLLFSLDKGEAFPVDVWVRRLIHEYYGFAVSGESVGQTVSLPANRQRQANSLPHRASATPGDREYDAIQRFAWKRWGEWAGYAQQYLFYGKRLGII